MPTHSPTPASAPLPAARTAGAPPSRRPMLSYTTTPQAPSPTYHPTPADTADTAPLSYTPTTRPTSKRATPASPASRGTSPANTASSTTPPADSAPCSSSPSRRTQPAKSATTGAPLHTAEIGSAERKAKAANDTKTTSPITSRPTRMLASTGDVHLHALGLIEAEGQHTRQAAEPRRRP
jgi:hypothetical protein